VRHRRVQTTCRTPPGFVCPTWSVRPAPTLRAGDTTPGRSIRVARSSLQLYSHAHRLATVPARTLRQTSTKRHRRVCLSRLCLPCVDARWACTGPDSQPHRTHSRSSLTLYQPTCSDCMRWEAQQRPYLPVGVGSCRRSCGVYIQLPLLVLASRVTLGLFSSEPVSSTHAERGLSLFSFIDPRRTWAA
jgi:hypothetical protein